MRFFSYYKDNSLVNLSNSILKRYNVKPFHKTIESLDPILKKHRKIALFLFDGFGQSISEKHLSENSFLRKNKFDTISSTFPPTTVAATNAFKSGLYPAENGWLGWSFLDKEKNRVVEYFTHRNYFTKEAVDDFDYSIFNYKSIFELIKEQNPDVTVVENYPSVIADGAKNGYNSMDDMLDRTAQILNENSECLIYSYYLEPDHSLHSLGTNHRKINEICSEINYRIEKFAKEHPDTLILVFADHSHLDVLPLFFEDLHELKECVTNIYAVEARASTFIIKEGREEAFLKYYNENLKEHYDLLTKQEVIDNKLFGSTNDNKRLEALLGDYFLIAIGTYSFENFKFDPMVATHAGGTKEENLINLYVINN